AARRHAFERAARYARTPVRPRSGALFLELDCRRVDFRAGRRRVDLRGHRTHPAARADARCNVELCGAWRGCCIRRHQLHHRAQAVPCRKPRPAVLARDAREQGSDDLYRARRGLRSPDRIVLCRGWHRRLSVLGTAGVRRAASVMIGLLLAAVAVALIAEARGLLVGEGVRLETARSIRAMALAQPGVRATGPILSMYIGPNEVLLTLDLMFAPDTPSERIDAAVRSL